MYVCPAAVTCLTCRMLAVVGVEDYRQSADSYDLVSVYMR